MKQFVTLFTFVVLSACSCGKQSRAETIPSESKVSNQDSQWEFIERNQWKLIQIRGKIITEFQPTIQFDRLKGAVAGSSGCNRYFGTFTADSEKMTLKIGGSTMMMCPDIAMNMEREYSSLLDSTSYSFDIAGQTLNLYDKGTLVLMFGREDKE